MSGEREPPRQYDFLADFELGLPEAEAAVDQLPDPGSDPGTERPVPALEDLETPEASTFNRREQKAITDTLGVFAWPILHHPGWSGAVPDFVREDIINSRFLQLFEAYRAANMTLLNYATDEEAMYYLSTASLAFPLTRDWAEIYQHCFCNWMTNTGREVTAELQEIIETRPELGLHQQEMLSELKRAMRRAQRRAVKRL